MRTGESNQKFSVHAIAGTHVITLAFDAAKKDTKNLMGFSIHRTKCDANGKDISKGGDWVKGYKPFKEIISDPQPKVTYPTNLHPWQSFVWADYAVEPDYIYKYKIVPVFGKPQKLTYGDELKITVKPEPIKDKLHEVHFNRGAAASQAYAIKFDNLKPNDKSLTEKEKKERYDWLSRGLFEAVTHYIEQAKDETYGLRAALYELEYPEIPKLFKAALDKGADVQIVYEAKEAKHKTKNQAALKEAGFKINDKKITYARQNCAGIAHNKFIVLLKNDEPVMVWTGSTNLSEGGIFGHSNVGHCIKDKNLAQQYLDYWDLLKKDTTTTNLKATVDETWPTLSAEEIPLDKMSVMFSPRKGDAMLQTYADVLGSAENIGIITLPFNIDEKFQTALEPESTATRYLMLNSGKTTPAKLKKLEDDPDIIVAPGAEFKNQWGQWLKEVHSGLSGGVVLYIHTKYLIKDPLGPSPLIIVGSANFSGPSMNSNDENMVIIPCSNKKGETRVQDIYLGEFFRLFDHWYFRYLQKIDHSSKKEQAAKRFLKSTSEEWINNYYTEGTDQYKRRNYFSYK